MIRLSPATIEHKEPHVGMSFHSYDELEKFMENYTNDSKQIFVKQKTDLEGPNNKKKENIEGRHKILFYCLCLQAWKKETQANTNN